MTEIKRLKQAKICIDKLANGIHPVSNTPLVNTDAVNDVQISRCLFFVSDVLRETIAHAAAGKGKNTKLPFSISAEQLKSFQLSEKPACITEIVRQINKLIDTQIYRKLSSSAVTSWLIEINALQMYTLSNGNCVKRPTMQGRALGIFTGTRQGENGAYTVVLYNRDAQQFLLDNIEAITAPRTTSEKAENQGHPWTAGQERQLSELFERNAPVSTIAAKLGRTERGIRARLKRLGLIDKRGDAR